MNQENVNLPNASLNEGWSWKMAFATQLALIAGKKWGFLIMSMVLIPLLNVIVFIVLFLIGGSDGKKWIRECDLYQNDSEKNGAIKALEMNGQVIAIFVAISILIMIAFALLMPIIMMNLMSGVN